MLRFMSLTLLLSFCNFIIGQSNQIEINPYLQWNSYPSFTTPFNSVMNSTIKIKGTNWGINANYKHFLKKNLLAKVGLGYTKYSFNHIQEYISLFGTHSSRSINYPGGSSTFGYVCNRYWYNTIAFTIGSEKLFSMKKNVNYFGGFDVTNYYTFSQRYNIGSNNHTKYKKDDGRYFGFCIKASAGLQKKFGRITIGPTISLPIFMIWKQDMVFPQEQNSKNRNKCLRGVGTSITCTYPLTKT